MRTLRKTGGILVLWSVLLASPSALAQGTAPETDTPARSTEASMLDPSAYAPMSATAPVSSTASGFDLRMGRFGMEVLGGLGGGLATGLVGFAATSLAMCGGFEATACSGLAAMSGGGLGAMLGILGGTLLVGHWMDGDGAWWAALTGVVVSASVGVFAYSQLSLIGEPFPGGLSIPTAIGVTLGAALLAPLGYELTSHVSARAFRDSKLALVPTLIPTAHGTMGGGLSLSGSWN